MQAIRWARPALLVLGLAACAAAQTLTIHQVNVQQGDCTLVVGPDGTTLLIDAGNSGKGSAEVIPYLRSIGIEPADGLDFVLATHRDADHIGGLSEVLAAYPVRRAVWDNGSSKPGGPTSAIGRWVNAANAAQAGPLAAIPLGEVIDLGGGATATCVAVHGEVVGIGPVSGATEENDLSVAVLVRFGDFEYITAGDLGGGDGDFDCTGRATGQANLESRLARALLEAGLIGPDGVEVLDVNHHGSESSSNADYMNLLSPTLAVINTGAGQGSNFHHPRADVVERVLLAQADCITVRPALVLQTEEGHPAGSNTSRAAFCVGDVVITTSGSGSFTVLGTGEVNQGPDERAAAGLAGGRSFPLDGSASPAPAGGLVITEIMMDPASVPDVAGEWFEVLNAGAAPVDLQGWTIADDDSDSHVIGVSLVVEPGRRVVLGRNGDPAQNGGYIAAYVYAGFNLANAADEVVLRDPSGAVGDRVAYTSAWPRAAGRSMSLKAGAADNADPVNWELSTGRAGSYTGGETDLGTPGSGGLSFLDQPLPGTAGQRQEADILGSFAIELAVGLVVLYLLLSTVCSAACEYLIHNLRPRLLRATLLRMFSPRRGPGGASPTNSELVDFLLGHGMFKIDGSGAPPSYISARSFAAAVVDALIPETQPSGSPARPPLVAALRETAQTLPPDTPAREAILAIFDRVGENLTRATEEIERWYAEAMDQISGVYKRRAQVVLFATGLVLATLINADTLMVARALSTDKELRTAVAKEAFAAAAREQNDGAEEPDPGAALRNAQEALAGTALPLGWSKVAGDPRALPWNGPYELWEVILNSLCKALGLLMTAAAVSFGAPFWFDVLNKVTNLRAGGPKPKRPEEEPPTRKRAGDGAKDDSDGRADA